MTPQLQQAIRLLQLSTLDLQAEILTQVEANPLLEIEDYNDTEQDREHLISATVASTPSSNAKSAIDIALETTATTSLTEYLLSQWVLVPLPEDIKTLGEMMIDYINEDGYLTLPLEEACQLCSPPCSLSTAQTAQKQLQKLDPLGVAASDLKDCLSIQLSACAEDTPWRAKAAIVIERYLTLLGKRDYTTLSRRLGLTLENTKAVISLIQSLNPRPGAEIGYPQPDYIVPDVLVSKKEEQWIVGINPELLPKLSINQQYASLLNNTQSEQDQCFIKSHLQEAKWLLKSLASRNDTLLKVSRCIVAKQQAFFSEGEIAMHPMTLQDVANEIEMHESTVSRITTQKYMHTPRGVFELKYFFSSQLTTDAGQACSSTAIKALIKQFVDEENTKSPLSDQKLSRLLAAEGINIARRTVAKYREEMNILRSNERRQLL